MLCRIAAMSRDVDWGRQVAGPRFITSRIGSLDQGKTTMSRMKVYCESLSVSAGVWDRLPTESVVPQRRSTIVLVEQAILLGSLSANPLLHRLIPTS